MSVVGWQFFDLESADVIAWTDDEDEAAGWFKEVRAGVWGVGIGVASVGADGRVVERLWPLA